MCDNRDRNSKPSLLLQNFKAETFSRVRVKTQVEVEVKIHGALLFVKLQRKIQWERPNQLEFPWWSEILQCKLYMRVKILPATA